MDDHLPSAKWIRAKDKKTLSKESFLTTLSFPLEAKYLLTQTGIGKAGKENPLTYKRNSCMCQESRLNLPFSLTLLCPSQNRLAWPNTDLKNTEE